MSVRWWVVALMTKSVLPQILHVLWKKKPVFGDQTPTNVMSLSHTTTNLVVAALNTLTPLYWELREMPIAMNTATKHI
ncbi:hypothetical protein D3C81_969980 [compost metagenome]